MNRGRSVSVHVVIALFILVIAMVCTGQPPLSPAGPDVNSVRELIGKGQYAGALTAVDNALKSAPKNPDLLLCKIDALLGLHRCVRARTLALANLSLGPAFRFKAGQCSASVGRVKEALRFWAPLLKDPTWAGRACEESVVGLLALGKEDEARTLLHRGIKVSPDARPELWALAVRLDGNAAQVKNTTPKAAGGEVGSLERVLAAVDGPLFGESLDGKLPARIKLKEKSERIEIPSLRWGAGGKGTPSIAGPASGRDIHAGTTSYGSGLKDTTSTEGTKTGTVSAAPRPVVEAYLNGGDKEYMVLDSASANVLLAPKVARKLDLKPIAPGDYRAIGLPSPVPSQWVLIRKMKVGELTFTNVPALHISQEAMFWKETGGVLPLWMFRHYALHYDPRHSRLTLYPPGTSATSVLGQGAFPLKCLWYGNRLYVESRIQNHPFCYLQMATANSGSYVEERRTGDLGLELATARHGPQKEQALFSLISSGVAENLSLDLGTTRINLRTILVADLCPDGQVDCCGLLGRNVLDLFDVFVDFESGVVALKGYEKGR